jgi:hypothetical protein
VRRRLILRQRGLARHRPPFAVHALSWPRRLGAPADPTGSGPETDASLSASLASPLSLARCSHGRCFLQPFFCKTIGVNRVGVSDVRALLVSALLALPRRVAVRTSSPVAAAVLRGDLNADRVRNADHRACGRSTQ